MVDNKHPAPPTPAAHEQAKAPPLAPPGSKDYVAGQPIDEAEQAKVEGEAAAKRKAAEDAARQAEHKVTDASKK